MVVVVCCGVDWALTGRDVGIGARIPIVLSIDSYIGKNLNFTRTSQKNITITATPFPLPVVNNYAIVALQTEGDD